MPEAVPLTDHQAEYDQAEKTCERISARWIKARAGGKMTPALDHEMDYALDELRRAKDHLERAERRSG